MRSDRTIGIQDRDRALQQRLKGPPHVQALRLAADEHRHRLELARRLTRRLGGRDPRGFGCHGGFARGRDGIEPRLQLGIGGGQLRLQLGDPGDRLRLEALRVLPRLDRGCGTERSLGCRQLRLGPGRQVFGDANRHQRARDLARCRHGGESRLIRLAGRLVGLRATGGGRGGGTRLRWKQGRVNDIDGRRIAGARSPACRAG